MAILNPGDPQPESGNVWSARPGMGVSRWQRDRTEWVVVNGTERKTWDELLGGPGSTFDTYTEAYLHYEHMRLALRPAPQVDTPPVVDLVPQLRGLVIDVVDAYSSTPRLIGGPIVLDADLQDAILRLTGAARLLGWTT